MNAHDMTKESALPYQRLCMAVIVQAIRDAAYPAVGSSLRASEATRDQRRALTWIKVPNPDFNEVCEGADLDPRAVRKHALEFIESGEPMPRNTYVSHARKPSHLSHRSIARRIGVSESAVYQARCKDLGSFELKRRVNATIAEMQREMQA